MTKERIGVDLGGTKIEAVVLGADGTVTWRKRIATPREYHRTVAAVTGLVAEIDHLDIHQRSRLGIAAVASHRDHVDRVLDGVDVLDVLPGDSLGFVPSDFKTSLDILDERID